MAAGQPAILIFDQESIGQRVAEARKLRGLTQDGLALLVPCSKSLISQVERGFKPATPWFVAAAARALHTDVPQLLGQPYRGRTEQAVRLHASIPQIRIVMNYWDVAPDVEVKPRPLTVVRNDIARVADYLDTVNYSRLCALLPGLIEELSAIYHGSATADRRVAAELLMYSFVAAKSLAYRLGYADLISVAVDRATWAAKEADNPELLAFTAEERCMVFFATGAYDAGIKFIDNAIRQYESAISRSPSGQAIVGSLHLRASIMAARNPRRRNDAWDHLGQARETGERIGRDTNHYGLIFGPANVRIHEVATALELDDADEAIRRANGFVPPATLPPERSSHHYIDLARAHLMVGHQDDALRSLAKADKLAPQHTCNHPMARETAAGLVRAHSKVPESLRSLARRMGIAA